MHPGRCQRGRMGPPAKRLRCPKAPPRVRIPPSPPNRSSVSGLSFFAPLRPIHRTAHAIGEPLYVARGYHAPPREPESPRRVLWHGTAFRDEHLAGRGDPALRSPARVGTRALPAIQHAENLTGRLPSARTSHDSRLTSPDSPGWRRPGCSRESDHTCRGHDASGA
jgi:hypothetical protein